MIEWVLKNNFDISFHHIYHGKKAHNLLWKGATRWLATERIFVSQTYIATVLSESTQTTELYISGSNVFTLLRVCVPELQHQQAHFWESGWSARWFLKGNTRYTSERWGERLGGLFKRQHRTHFLQTAEQSALCLPYPNAFIFHWTESNVQDRKMLQSHVLVQTRPKHITQFTTRQSYSLLLHTCLFYIF